jgi:arsenate reductase-like glutaredoxin family protein
MINRDSARHAVQELLNDVIEQGFHHLLRHPQQGDGLNQIIKEATGVPESDPSAQAKHYREVISETELKSLQLLSRLQKIQQLDNPRLKRV